MSVFITRVYQQKFNVFRVAPNIFREASKHSNFSHNQSCKRLVGVRIDCSSLKHSVKDFMRCYN